MTSLPACPECGSEFTYQDQNRFVCPECAHEWLPEDQNLSTVIRDSVGNQDCKIPGFGAIRLRSEKVKKA